MNYSSQNNYTDNNTSKYSSFSYFDSFDKSKNQSPNQNQPTGSSYHGSSSAYSNQFSNNSSNTNNKYNQDNFGNNYNTDDTSAYDRKRRTEQAQYEREKGDQEETTSLNNENMGKYSNNSLKQMGRVGTPEDYKYFEMFNTKRDHYRLKHYLYFSNALNYDFQINNYNKLSKKQGRPPLLKYYNRYYDMKYDNELDPKGKYYGNMYTLTDGNQQENIVYTREYRGVYSMQPDYMKFKMMMQQEGK